MRQGILHFCQITFLISAIFVCVSGAYAKPSVIFSTRDRVGDDFGQGSFTYPLDETFEPGVFDITAFTVLADDASVYFQFTFSHMTNPWNAPEGFYHQRIDLFIDSRPGIGKTEPMRPGPGEIRFDPQHPWDLWVRVAPWDGAQLFAHTDPPDLPGRTDGIHVRLADPETIEVVVPQDLIPYPQAEWRYYVLVGSFDGLGIDGYREVVESPTRWLLGGGGESMRIIDLVGPRWGARAQSKQLSVLSDGTFRLYPVGRARGFGWSWLFVATALLIAIGGWVAWRRRA